jgi:Histidine kinase
MLTAAPSMPFNVELHRQRSSFLYWLLTHRGAVAVAGLLAFAGPVIFMTGTLSVMREPTAVNIARLSVWWTLYGISLWCLLLAIGYSCERVAARFGRYVRGGIWLVGACSAAVVANALTAERATILIEQGLVHSARTMHLHGFIFSLIMALLYFAHLRRSRMHEQAAARLAAAQTAQRYARRRIVQSRLQEVQARIDPQLLFEMLDAARRLYESDAAQSERFVDELIIFLRAALPRLRTASSSMLREIELAQAFVKLHALAGADGLNLAVDVAPGVLHARCPPGVLLPLLDGAVRSAGPCQLTVTRSNGDCRLVLTLAAAPSEASAARVQLLLTELYASMARLEIENIADAISVIVHVPYELA